MNKKLNSFCLYELLILGIRHIGLSGEIRDFGKNMDLA
jgi:hypothetical protein